MTTPTPCQAVLQCAASCGITDAADLDALNAIYCDGARDGAQNIGRLSHLKGHGVAKEIERLEEKYGDEEGLIFDLYNAAHQLGLEMRNELGLRV